MDWTEVSIYTTTEGIEPVCGRLLGVGVTGFVIRDAKDFEEFLNNKQGNWDYIDDDLMHLKDCETAVIFYLADNSQGADMLSLVRSEMEELSRLDKTGAFGRLAVELSNIREEDWANNWKQYFKPLCVGERLIIKPSWENVPENEGRTVLEIDPASSFGTGQHSTTQLCLEALEKCVVPQGKVLDLGCGSGILSIAALLLGAGQVCAVDIDLNSVRIAAENAEKNHIDSSRYKTLCGNIVTDKSLRDKIGTGYSLITANIVADVLIAMAPYMGEFLADGGKVIISGIITERRDEVISVYQEKGFSVISLSEAGGWAAAVLLADKKEI